MSDNGIPSVSQITLAQVAEVVRKHYGEDIWHAVKIGLAVVLSLSLTGRDNCVVLVYEGASGQGKSITIRLLMSDRDSTARYLIRIDDFTPASFVSHAANRKASRLQQIDLLPRVKDKVMLT
jgi:alpha-D-ribose 1-methylphosphonate 5-triphosphate synthase subunit PhnL